MFTLKMTDIDIPFTTKLPENILDKLLVHPDCDDPQEWFVWGLPDGALRPQGALIPVSRMGLCWAREQEIASYDAPLLNALDYAPSVRDPQRERDMRAAGMEIPHGIWYSAGARIRVYRHQLRDTPFEKLTCTLPHPTFGDPVEETVAKFACIAHTYLNLPMEPVETHRRITYPEWLPFVNGPELWAEKYTKDRGTSYTREAAKLSIVAFTRWYSTQLLIKGHGHG